MEALKLIAQNKDDREVDVVELNELQLALVGGGAGDVVFH